MLSLSGLAFRLALSIRLRSRARCTETMAEVRHALQCPDKRGAARAKISPRVEERLACRNTGCFRRWAMVQEFNAGLQLCYMQRASAKAAGRVLCTSTHVCRRLPARSLDG